MVATLNALEAAALLASTEVDVVDVRDFEEWQGGHLPTARVVPLEVLRADIDRELRGPKAAVLFVCARGVRSLNAAKMAERLGYENVYNLEGGISGWAQAGLPIVTEHRRRAHRPSMAA